MAADTNLRQPAVLCGMHLRFASADTHAVFELRQPQYAWSSSPEQATYKILWNRHQPTELALDGIRITIQPGHILALTPFHHVTLPAPNQSVVLYTFSEEFYCVEKHDREVSCIGLLFYGATDVTTLMLDVPDQARFGLLHDMLCEEFQTADTIQREMLTVLLARMIILCTRIARTQQLAAQTIPPVQELIRQFNILVETHFREQHEVQFYAAALHRSPKTLANTLSQARQPSPIATIHNRLILEARRLLQYTDKSIKEIASDLNFSDLQTFCRFFKLKTQTAPSALRKGKTD